MNKSNPTQKTQRKIIEIIEKSEMPMTITAIAEKAHKNIYAVQETIKFLEQVGLVRTLITSGNSTIVLLNKLGDKNGTAN